MVNLVWENRDREGGLLFILGLTGPCCFDETGSLLTRGSINKTQIDLNRGTPPILVNLALFCTRPWIPQKVFKVPVGFNNSMHPLPFAHLLGPVKMVSCILVLLLIPHILQLRISFSHKWCLWTSPAELSQIEWCLDWGAGRQGYHRQTSVRTFLFCNVSRVTACLFFWFENYKPVCEQNLARLERFYQILVSSIAKCNEVGLSGKGIK